jgi:hypothetical protein
LITVVVPANLNVKLFINKKIAFNECSLFNNNF